MLWASLVQGLTLQTGRMIAQDANQILCFFTRKARKAGKLEMCPCEEPRITLVNISVH